jgi:hypothetical protein
MSNPYDPYGRGGYGAAPPQYDLTQFRQEMAQLRQELGQHLQGIAGMARGADKRAADAMQRLDSMSKSLDSITANRRGADSGIVWEKGPVRVEDIPGRRVPFTLLVDIPIGANTTSVQQASVTISQEGPFVAVKRMATFMSAFEFQVSQQELRDKFQAQVALISRYSGRSFGRYRPIHSAWDLNDAVASIANPDPILFLSTFFSNQQQLNGCINGGVIPSFTTSASGFRTMEFDGRIAVINAGSSYPRQNITVPSSFWSPEINAPQELGALDFFERGEILTFEVTPNHVNNPPAGNADGQLIWQMLSPTGEVWPFVQGQYDPHEGIATPCAISAADNGPVPVTPDPIQRLPDGIMTLGWEGYRIIQPISP